MVTVSNQVLVTMADFGDDLEIVTKMCWLRKDLMKTTTQRAMQRLCPRSADAEGLTTNRDHQESALSQLSPALQSELKKLQQVATRGSGVSKAEWDKVCKAAFILLLRSGSRTPDVEATFTSHATGRRGQHVFDTIAMDADDNCKNESVENEASSEEDESTDEDPTESKKPKQERL